MSAESESTGSGLTGMHGLKIVLTFLLLPLLPIAVGLNIHGLADKLSGLPGIKSGGGIISGVSALVLVSIIMGVLICGSAAVAGGQFPMVGSGNSTEEPTRIATPTKTELPSTTTESSPTVTSEPTPTRTPSFKQRNPELAEFEESLRERMMNHDPGLVEAPVLATKYHQQENSDIELWVIFDEIEPETSEEAEDMRTQWSNVAIWYANTVGNHDGQKPDRLVAVGLNKKFNNTHFTVPSEEAQSAFDGKMNKTEYTNRWWNRMSGHDEDAEISQYARELVEQEGVRTPTDSRDG